MKNIIENVLDATSVLYRLFLAAICYQVHPSLAMIMIGFYLTNTVFAVWHYSIKMKEEKEFIETLKGKIHEITIKDENDSE